MSVNRKIKNPFDKLIKQRAFLNPYNYPLNEFPFYVDIELTNNCTIDCIMCRRTVMEREKGYMGQEVFKKIIDEVSQYKCGIRFVRQGEPTLHPNLVDFIKYAKEKKIKVYVSTNGYFPLNKMKEVFYSLPDVIRFSFQGTNEDTFEFYRRPSKYNMVKRNIHWCSRERENKKWIKPYLIIGTSVTDEPEHEIEAFRHQWLKVVDKVEVGKTLFSHVEASRLEVDQVKKNESVERVYKPCIEILIKLSVDWDGDISACCQDHNKYMVLGNIKLMTLKEAWNCEKENRFRGMLGKKLMHKLFSLCRNCYDQGTTDKFDNIKEEIGK